MTASARVGLLAASPTTALCLSFASCHLPSPMDPSTAQPPAPSATTPLARSARVFIVVTLRCASRRSPCPAMRSTTARAAFSDENAPLHLHNPTHHSQLTHHPHAVASLHAPSLSHPLPSPPPSILAEPTASNARRGLGAASLSKAASSSSPALGHPLKPSTSTAASSTSARRLALGDITNKAALTIRPTPLQASLIKPAPARAAPSPAPASPLPIESTFGLTFAQQLTLPSPPPSPSEFTAQSLPHMVTSLLLHARQHVYDQPASPPPSFTPRPDDADAIDPAALANLTPILDFDLGF